jgi:hypothetical protein
MGTFDTGDTFEGKTFKGYASEGFTKTGGVTKIKSGGKYSKGKITYKKGQATKKTEPAQYEIKTSTGETVQVQKEESPSYDKVIKAREKELIRNAEEGNKLTEQQKAEIIKNQQGSNRGIALDYEQIDNINKFGREQGIGTGKDFFNATREGRVTLEGTTNEEGRTELSGINVTSTKEEIYNLPKNEKKINELYTPKAEEYEQTPGQRTNINEGKKDLRYFIPSESTVRLEQQRGALSWVSQGVKKGKELFYKNVEQPYLTGKTNEAVFAAGSFFYGLEKVGFSIWRTFEGNTIKNLFVPWSNEAQGFIPETIQTIKHPVSTASNLIKGIVKNPYEVAGELYGTKSIFTATSPIKSITIEKMPIPTLTAKTIRNAEGISTTFKEGSGTIIKGVKVESKTLGIKNTRFSTKIISYFENPAYTQFLNKNPMYRDLIGAEIVIPKGTETVYNRVISKNERGETVIKSVAETKKPEPYAEIEPNEFETYADFYKDKVWDPNLKSFVPKKSSKNTVSRFTGEDEGGFSSGGSGESSGLNKNPFDNIGELNKGGGLGSNNQFEGITAVTSGNKKLILIEPETEPTQIIRLKDIMKQEGTINPGLSIYTQNKLNQLGSIFTSTSNKTEAATGTRNITTTANKNAVIQHQQIINAQALKIFQTTKTSTASKTVTKTAQTTAQVNALAQVQAQTQAQKQIQVSALKTIRITKTPPPIIITSRYEGEKNKNLKATGFNVLVKQKGIFTKINTKPLNLKSALGLGSETVERSSSATFKITSPETPGGIFTSKTPKGFYKKGNLFIEEQRRRINTAGEFNQISSKGRASKKIRKLYGV